MLVVISSKDKVVGEVAHSSTALTRLHTAKHLNAHSSSSTAPGRCRSLLLGPAIRHSCVRPSKSRCPGRTVAAVHLRQIEGCSEHNLS